MIPDRLGIDLRDGTELLCPVCGDFNTHLEGVQFSSSLSLPAYVRIEGSEDEETSAVSVRPGVCRQINNSLRRDTAMMIFTCEQDHLFGISFTQHKGTTFVVQGSLN